MSTNTNNTIDCNGDPTCFPWCSWTPGRSQNNAVRYSGFIFTQHWDEVTLGFWFGPEAKRGYRHQNLSFSDYFWESDQENCLTPP